MASAGSAPHLEVPREGRMNLSSLDTELFPVGLPRPGDVIELHGPEGSGKTEVVYRLLASCLLPVEAGGLGMRAILLDVDLHFDLLRLVGLLERRIRAAKRRPGQAGDQANSHIGASVGGSDGCADGIVETGGNCASGCGNVGGRGGHIDGSDCGRGGHGGSRNCVSGSTSGPGGPTGDRQCLLGGNRVVCENKCNVDGDRDLITEDDDDEAAAELALRECLSCLSIATCHTASQLELTLLALEEQVALPPLFGSSRPHVGLLVLDGLSAFYWMDQPCPGSVSVTERCCEVLNRMARQQGLVLIATTQQLFRPWRQQASRGAGPRPLLGRAWHALVTLRFVFGRDDGGQGTVTSKTFSLELDRAPGGTHFRRSFVISEDGVRLL
ncbi:DNA repair protein XRCC2 isoform X2 [Lampetra planeri]